MLEQSVIEDVASMLFRVRLVPFVQHQIQHMGVVRECGIGQSSTDLGPCVFGV